VVVTSSTLRKSEQHIVGHEFTGGEPMQGHQIWTVHDSVSIPASRPSISLRTPVPAHLAPERLHQDVRTCCCWCGANRLLSHRGNPSEAGAKWACASANKPHLLLLPR
jgi:hypothetical protein